MIGGEVEEKTQWTVHIQGPDLGVFGTEHTFAPAASQSAARHRLDFYRERRPDVESILLVRDVEIHRGPWRPAEV